MGASASRYARAVLIAVALFLALPAAWAADPCTLRLQIDGAIGPGTLDYVERAQSRAETLGCGSILLRLNTPGGSLTTTRELVERVLASKIPFLCLVAPEGGHAGSAGAILLLACHVAGAENATNIGAATPITGMGQSLTDDLRKKVVEDTVSWAQGLARLRGRSLEFAKTIVTDARAVDATEARQMNAIDVLSTDEAHFLQFAATREVTLAAGARAKVVTGAIVDFEPDLRTRVLASISDPQLAYLLFMASLALLYFEFTHTGVMVPGVTGAIGLIVALIAFQNLDVWWGGVSLIVLGLAFFLAEAFVPAFGSLGIGGLIALAAGSFLLYGPGSDPLPIWLIALTCAVAGAFMLALAVLAFRTRRLGRSKGGTPLIGRKGEVLKLESARSGQLAVQGETWRYESVDDVLENDAVEILAIEGLTLKVRRWRQEG